MIVPGGFSYGDYLRCGALARFSPVMEDVAAFAKAGGPVLGICNGFQILCEAGLLPGVLMRNASLKYICRDVTLKVEGQETPVTRGLAGRTLTMPIAHGEGNYFADAATLDRLEGEGQVVFRYVGRRAERRRPRHRRDLRRPAPERGRPHAAPRARERGDPRPRGRAAALRGAARLEPAPRAPCRAV